MPSNRERVADGGRRAAGEARAERPLRLGVGVNDASVKNKKVCVLLGPGAEEGDNLDSTWICLLRSGRNYKAFLEALADTIIHVITSYMVRISETTTRRSSRSR